MDCGKEKWREKGLKPLHSSCVFSDEEIQCLRRLADRVAYHAHSDEMKRKASLWLRHNDMETDEPVINISPENGWAEILPVSILECQDPLARQWEMELRMLITWAEFLKDDKVIEPYFDVGYSYWDTGWGVEMVRIGGGHGTSYAIKAAIEDYEEDFEKIHAPQIIIDWEESGRIMELAKRVFGDILTVRRKQDWWWSLGLTDDYIHLRDLENFMCDFVLEPEWLKRMLDLMCRGNLEMLDFLEENDLLFQNLEGTYIGSGGFCFTNQIRKKGPGEKIRTMDTWGFFESQATVSVSPDMYGEFIFPHHKKMSERFGLNQYGCCEPFEPVWKYVKTIPRLRRVSVSPWSDWEKVPEILGKNYLASVKPTPSSLAWPVFNEKEVRRDCRRAVEATKGGLCEFIMKDTTTFGGDRNNAKRWVEVMREEVDRVYG